MLKIYTFTDESGQDTNGEVFIVCTVIVEQSKIEEINSLLESVELVTKYVNKWSKSTRKKRLEFVKNLPSVLKHLTIYYSIFNNTKAYTPAIAENIGKSLHAYCKDTSYNLRIVLDSQTEKDTARIKTELRQSGISFKHLTTTKDEKSPCVRLADAMCGLIRDTFE
jgi:hypothetical protein